MVNSLKTWWWFRRLPVLLGILGDAGEGNSGAGPASALPKLTQGERTALTRLLPRVHPKHLARAARRLHREDILECYDSDPWLRNYFLNWWEFAHGEAVLSTYPWNITIPIADVCNARCTFCTSWLEGTRVLNLDEVPQFAEVLRYARLLGIAGHGEPLAHPRCDELFEKMASYLDPRCESYIITNGVFLEKRKQSLRRLNLRTYNISLNAATAETHDTVMGLGSEAFGTILTSIQRLSKERDKTHVPPGKTAVAVNISFVINRDNVHEMANFVRLGNTMGVNNIYLRTLSNVSSPAVGLNYHLLPPYLHPDFEKHVQDAEEAIAESKANVITDVASWSTPVLPQGLTQINQMRPPVVMERKDALKSREVRDTYARFYEDVKGTGQPLSEAERDVDISEDGTNPFNRQPPYHCYFVYHDFIINDFNLRFIPCCYMSRVPGFEVIRYNDSRPFMDYWNSPAFVTLRKRLQEGPLYGACKKCPAQDVVC